MLSLALSFPWIRGTWPNLGHIEAEGPIHEDLAGRVVDMVVSPDDVGDAHEGVIDYDREIVRGRVVLAEYDKIVKLFGLKGDLSAHHIVEGDGAGKRAF